MPAEQKFNTEFIKSRYGIVRVAEAICALIGIICVGSGSFCGHYGKYGFYEFVAASSLVLIICFFILMFFKFDQYVITRVNLPLTFLIHDALYTVCYAIAAILLFVTFGCAFGRAARIVGSIFAVLNFLMFGFSTLEDYHWFKTGAAPFQLSQTTPTSAAQPA